MTRQFDVAEVVPHAGTMSLLSEIRDYGEDYVTAGVDITPQTLFCQTEGVPAWVGIEYMAQTIGAFAGIQERLQGGRPKVGYLVGTRRYQCSVPYFPVGSRIDIRVVRSFQADNGLGVFDCELKVGEVVVTAALNVYQPEDTDAFMQDTEI